MMSNPSTKPPMRSASASESASQAANSYRPSVPISVYRELSAELQATQAMLDSVNTQNQQLVQQNQQLRQEIEKVVQTALHLQQVIDSFQSPASDSAVTSPSPSSEVRSEPIPSKRRPPQNRPRPAAPTVEVMPPSYQPEPMASPGYAEHLVTEHEEGRYRRPAQPERSSDVSGWWLVVVIFLIVATAFGTGFLIVRPLLNSR